MSKKFTFCLGTLAAMAGFSAIALANVSNAPLRVEGEDPEEPEVIIYTPPVVFAPTVPQFEQCHVFDQNDDQKTWRLEYDNGEATFKYSYHNNNPADDWCILPIMQMEPGMYKISYTYRTNSDPENFKILFGQGWEPEGYTQVLLEKEGYQNSRYVTESNAVTIEEAGEYHIALYAFSDPYKYFIFIKNITVELLSELKPGVPEATMTSSGFEGIMSITLPSETYFGVPMSGEVSAQVEENGEVIATITGTPGEVIEQAITVESRGEHTYTLRAFVESEGENIYSEPISITHFFTRLLPNPLPLGYVIEPDDDQFDACTIEDQGSDGYTWKLYTYQSLSNREYPYCFRYNNSYTESGDDWLILPAYEAVESGAVKVSFLYGTEAARESVEMAVATSADIETLQENIVWGAEEYSTGGKFEKIDVECGVEANEQIYIAFHCKSPASRGYAYLQGITMVATSPLVPKRAQIEELDFDGGNGTVKVILPEATITNEPFAGSVFAEVTLDGEPFGEPLEGSAGQEFTLTFEGLERGEHTLSATSYVMVDEERLDGSTTTVDFRIKRGSQDVFTPPCTITLDQDIVDDVVIVNSNADADTWSYDTSEDAFRYKYNSQNAADDWLILPAVQISAINFPFKVTVDSRVYSASYTERFEVFMGTEQTPEAMTIRVMEPTELSSTEYGDFESEVTLPETGNYYIGIHAISDKDRFYLYMRSVSIVSTDPNVGVEAAKAVNGTVSGLRGAIRLSGFAGEQVSIYTMGGQTIQTLKADGNAMVAVPAGMYLVKAGEKTFKVVVK